MDQFPIARLRYTTATKSWTLFWHDRNLSFHPYDLLATSQSVEEAPRRAGPRPH
jgi:hypothetical protein